MDKEHHLVLVPPASFGCVWGFPQGLLHFAPEMIALAEGTFSLVSVNEFHTDGTFEFKLSLLPITYFFVLLLQNFVRHHWVHRRRQEGKCKQCGKVRLPVQHKHNTGHLRIQGSQQVFLVTEIFLS